MTEPQSAGATPVAGGATLPQTPALPAAPASGGTSTPATGDPDGLGDAGKRAIQQERDARSAATRERDEFKRQLEELQNASKTDHEKAIAQARKEGAAEVLGKYQVAVRRSEVRAALSAAGISTSLLDLAVKADEFSALKVTDDGDVEGLSGAVDAFKKARPDLFKAPSGGGAPDFGGGPRGTPAGAGQDMNALIRRAAGRTA
jgi:hypothetical protein